MDERDKNGIKYTPNEKKNSRRGIRSNQKWGWPIQWAHLYIIYSEVWLCWGGFRWKSCFCFIKRIVCVHFARCTARLGPLKMYIRQLYTHIIPTISYNVQISYRYILLHVHVYIFKSIKRTPRGVHFLFISPFCAHTVCVSLLLAFWHRARERVRASETVAEKARTR